jgi:hypothetical protein
MRLIAILLFAVAFHAACFAEDPVSKFTNGFGMTLGEKPLDASVRRAASARVDSETKKIARAVLGEEIAEGLTLAVKWSDGNTNGFEPFFEARRSLVAALGQERVGALHNAYGARYLELVEGEPSATRILDPSYPPPGDFLKRYENTGG